MKTQKYLTPSGQEFVLRELSGEDDDIINAGAKDESEVINRYVANTIKEGPDGKSWTPLRVKSLPLRDKYFLLIASRILNLGPKLIFEYEWEGYNHPVEHEEDLNLFVWDYSEPFPTKDDPNYFDQRIAPYPEDMEAIFDKVGGFEIRMDFLNGTGEEYLLNLKASKKTINSELRARNLSVFVNEKWQKVENFASFTQRDMVQIRALAHDLDPQMEGLVTIHHPEMNQVEQVPLLAIKDFFYPVKI